MTLETKINLLRVLYRESIIDYFKEVLKNGPIEIHTKLVSYDIYIKSISLENDIVYITTKNSNKCIIRALDLGELTNIYIRVRSQIDSNNEIGRQS